MTKEQLIAENERLRDAYQRQNDINHKLVAANQKLVETNQYLLDRLSKMVDQVGKATESTTHIFDLSNKAVDTQSKALDENLTALDVIYEGFNDANTRLENRKRGLSVNQEKNNRRSDFAEDRLKHHMKEASEAGRKIPNHALFKRVNKDLEGSDFEPLADRTLRGYKSKIHV